MQGAPDERLDQARKVQQLLAALKQPQNGLPGTATPPTMPPGPPPLPHNAPYYSQPPPSGMPPYPGHMPPPPSAYPTGPPAAPTPPPGSAGAGANALPPNIMALLQQAQSRPPGGPAAPYGMPPGPPGGAPPAQYQQLMSYLVRASTLTAMPPAHSSVSRKLNLPSNTAHPCDTFEKQPLHRALLGYVRVEVVIRSLPLRLLTP